MPLSSPLSLLGLSIKALIVGSGLGMVYQCKSLELLLRSVCVCEKVTEIKTVTFFFGKAKEQGLLI